MQPQSLNDIYNSLTSTYQPQLQNIQNQIGSVQGQQQAQQAGLDTQESNAFKGIQNQANSNGMYYSGVTPDQENTYVGGTYLPAVAQLKANTNNQVYNLQSAYNQLGQQQNSQAQGIYQNQQQYQQQQDYLNKQLALQQAQNQGMLNLYGGQARGSSGGGGGSTASPYAMSYNNAGGLDFTMNGKPVTAAQYAQANGTTVASLLSQSKSAGDAALLKKIQSATTPAAQAALRKQYAYVFGGV